ncbi:MAG: sigma 54-dependent Fis family transcriptional regulator [Deltaproteobacteria bacterium]|nr:sigma 54-dependent Fis family transcriptional regulator [Deltaproteobacteria bacterium]
MPTVSTQRPQTSTARAVRVTVVAGPDAGQTISCAGPQSIVGRSPTADARLGDPTTSSFHAELSAEAGGVRVRDLQSLNGTFYQGARIESAVVPPGSLLQCGSSTLRVELDAVTAEQTHALVSFGELRGTSLVMRELFTLMTRLASTDLSLLIEGPTGTGKELAARALHESSSHAHAPFVVLDCTAIPSSLAESTLFGHERGAFTGATERRPGVFEAAADGTVFLDEVGELAAELQPKLLRVLEQRQVVRVGGTQPVAVRARILSATLRDLRAAVNQGRFREDLYFRLAQARLCLPPLGDRPEDIALLVHHFLSRLPATARCARSISEQALRELCTREFPGNVRELRHTVERAAALAESDVIAAGDLAFERMLMGERQRSSSVATEAAQPDATPQDLVPFKEAKRTLIDEFERGYLDRLLTRAGRNLSRASALAGVERHHLRDLLRKHGLWTEE